MDEFTVLEELSPAIQAAAATVCFFEPGYCAPELLVADITLWCLDHSVLEDVASMELFGERVWWLMAVGLRLVKAGLHEYENNTIGEFSVD